MADEAESGLSPGAACTSLAVPERTRRTHGDHQLYKHRNCYPAPIRAWQCTCLVVQKSPGVTLHNGSITESEGRWLFVWALTCLQ
jgi:hypothetical protein